MSVIKESVKESSSPPQKREGWKIREDLRKVRDELKALTEEKTSHDRDTAVRIKKSLLLDYSNLQREMAGLSPESPEEKEERLLSPKGPKPTCSNPPDPPGPQPGTPEYEQFIQSLEAATRHWGNTG
jgi:hypothetical protein